jgi:hypothetical protein
MIARFGFGKLRAYETRVLWAANSYPNHSEAMPGHQLFVAAGFPTCGDLRGILGLSFTDHAGDRTEEMKNVDPIRKLREVGSVATELADQLQRLRRISVPAASRLLQIPKEAVRRHFKVRVYGPKTHRVSLDDIEAFDKGRTLESAK